MGGGAEAEVAKVRGVWEERRRGRASGREGNGLIVLEEEREKRRIKMEGERVGGKWERGERERLKAIICLFGERAAGLCRVLQMETRTGLFHPLSDTVWADSDGRSRSGAQQCRGGLAVKCTGGKS